MEHLFNLLYNRTGGFILLYEFLIILSINYLGVILEKVFHLPTPGTVNGLILLFIFLSLKVIKLNSIKNVGEFFIANMIITFIPPSVKLLDRKSVV